MLKLADMKPPTKQPRKLPRTGFYKGIPGFTISDDDLMIKAAEASIYRCWWDFMRLSPVFWYARITGKSIVDAEVARAYELAGDLTLPSFAMWWQRHGRYVFEEAYRPADARVIDLEQLGGHAFYQQSALIEIPLTVTRKKILRDVRRILDQLDHRLNALSVIGNSQAKLKLKSKKFNLNTIENEYWVLIYRILHPTLPLWKLGDRLQLSPTNDVRGRLPSDVAEHYARGYGPFARLQSLTGRNLYKARFARHHVERGSFPNYTKVEHLTTTMPFGSQAHNDFVEATREDATTESVWQQVVRQTHEQDLHFRILRKNQLDRLVIRDASAKARFPQFVAGMIDLTK